LSTSVAELVSWYADNEEWWKKLKNTEEFLEHYEKQSKAQYY